MAGLGWGTPSLRAAGHATCVHSMDPTLRAMWPDGQQDITEVTKRPLTAGTLFKNSMVALVGNLASKVPPSPSPPWILAGPSICAWVSSRALNCLYTSWGGGVCFLSVMSPHSTGEGPTSAQEAQVNIGLEPAPPGPLPIGWGQAWGDSAWNLVGPA